MSYWRSRTPTTAWEAVCAWLALFAAECRSLGDTANEARFRNVLKETRDRAPDPRQLDLVESSDLYSASQATIKALRAAGVVARKQH